MKSGKLFWGFFFISLGLLIFGYKFDYFYINLGDILDFWPLLLILWGLAIIAKDSFIKPVISVVSGVFLGLLVFSFFNFNIYFDDDYFDEDIDLKSKTYTEDFTDSVKVVDLNINGYINKLKIGQLTSELVKAEIVDSYNDFVFESFDSENKKVVNIRQKRYNIKELDKDFDAGRLKVKLNPAPIWNLNIDVKVSKAELNLNEFEVKSLEINSKAADIDLILGENYPDTEVHLESKASLLNLSIPHSSGCKLIGNWNLLIKDLDEFKKVNDNLYITPNFENAENKVIINLDSKLSKLNIDRY